MGRVADEGICMGEGFGTQARNCATRGRGGSAARSTPRGASGGSTRVLVIDDSEAIHSDFVRILSECDNDGDLDKLATSLFGTGDAPVAPRRCVVDLASQGPQGVELARDALARGEPYVVAFVDMRMPPGPGGVETTAALWAVDPTLQVVLCTAYSEFRWDDMLAALGTTEHLHVLRKPFSAVQVRRITQVLAAKAERLRR